ncbi:hypothetical protein [Nonomuraea insulae]|uniref:hypothetical protein n=1 Tax=Nonomuraea insulae TaxID=1616787 RepID=UPI0036D3FA6E
MGQRARDRDDHTRVRGRDFLLRASRGADSVQSVELVERFGEIEPGQPDVTGSGRKVPAQ